MARALIMGCVFVMIILSSEIAGAEDPGAPPDGTSPSTEAPADPVPPDGSPTGTMPDDTASGETTPDMEEEASTPEGAQRVTERLASEFHVDASVVTELREQRMGFGEIHHALSLAEQMPGGVTDENLGQIMAMRQEQKLGWGRIAQELETKLGPPTKRGPNEPSTNEPPVAEPPTVGEEPGTTTIPTTAQAESLIRPGASRAADKQKGDRVYRVLCCKRGKGGMERSGDGHPNARSGGTRHGGAPTVGGGLGRGSGGGLGQGGGPGARGKSANAPGHPGKR
jgi:hypothetical protein